MIAVSSRRWLWIAAGFAVASCWDRAAWLHLSTRDATARAQLESSWWYDALYAIGRLELWLLIGAAVVLGGLGRPVVGLRRAVAVIVAALAGGAFTEGPKIIFRRVRPDAADGWYHFRSFLDRPFSGSGLGLPSSHAGVAFAAAIMLGWIFPRARSACFVLAAACGASRVLSGAHFISDVYAGAILGWLGALAARGLFPSNNDPKPIAAPIAASQHP